jgi:Fe-S oxidoreductase
MFVEDYRELGIAGADEVAPRCVLFEQFVEEELSKHSSPSLFKNMTGLTGHVSAADNDREQARPLRVAVHAHCHAKAIIKPQFMAKLAERIPGVKATMLDTGCCGMAGAFGMLESKYELSKAVAADLLGKIDQAQADVVVASGTSCRHQLHDLGGHKPQHMAELLAAAIA